MWMCGAENTTIVLFKKKKGCYIIIYIHIINIMYKLLLAEDTHFTSLGTN